MAVFTHPDRFESRHIGPRAADVESMLKVCGFSSMEQLVDSAVPAAIRSTIPEGVLPSPRSERETLAALAEYAAQNVQHRNYLGLGYYPA